MADCKVSSTRDDAERAICRLVEVTSGHGTDGIRYFGPGCLVKIENTEFLHSVGTPKSKYFLVASKEVLAKGHLEALKKREEQRREHKSTVKMMAEFPELKDKRKLQRLPLDELYVSIEEDVFQLHGITYVALSKWEKRLFGKSSLLNRALDVVSTEQEETSTMLTSDQLQCLVFCGESTTNTVGDKNVFELSTRVYDLLHVDSVLASDESRSSSYFLRNEEKQRFLREDQFEENERPFGSIILSKDYKLAGMLNFINNNPVPVIVGTGSGTEATGACGVFSHYSQEAYVLPKAGEKHDVTEKEVHAGASGGIYPFLDSQSKYEVGTEATNKSDVSTLPQPAVTAPTGNQFVAGLEDGSKSEESSGDCGATADPQQSLPGVDGAQEAVQNRNNHAFFEQYCVFFYSHACF